MIIINNNIIICAFLSPCLVVVVERWEASSAVESCGVNTQPATFVKPKVVKE